MARTKSQEQETDSIRAMPEQEPTHINDLFTMKFRTDDPSILVGIRPGFKPGTITIYPIKE